MRLRWKQIRYNDYIATVKGYRQKMRWVDDAWNVMYCGPYDMGVFAESTRKKAEHRLKVNLMYSFKRIFYTPTGCVKRSVINLRDYDNTNLSRLMKSIKKKGILRPIQVTYMDEGYDLMILDGVCRYLAVKRLGLRTIPVTFDLDIGG